MEQLADLAASLMPDLQCRVTVIGSTARIDAAVPSNAAIAEYIDSLAALCEEPGNDTFPPAWTLGTADRRPLPPSSSLGTAGVVDGQVLYLRDLTAGEYDEPLNLEVDELVAGAASRSGGPPWNARTRRASAFYIGVLWLIAAPVTWLLDPGRPGGDPGAMALIAGLVTAGLAWAGARSRLGMPASARTALALCTVPCFGVAGWFLIVDRAGSDPAAAAVGLTCGATLGAIIALSAVPGAATMATLILAAVADAVAGVLAFTHARPVQDAAVVAIVAYLVLVCAPTLAGLCASVWNRLSTWDGDGDVAVTEIDAEETVRTARRLLIGLHAAGSLALAVAFMVLGTTRDRYAVALTVSLCVAAVLRTVAARFLLDAVPQVAAGLVGLFVVILDAPDTLGVPAWIPAAAGLGLGVMALGVGLTLGLRTAAGIARTPGRPVPAWARFVVTLCSVGALPLTLGVFGVFDLLVGIGRRI